MHKAMYHKQDKKLICFCNDAKHLIVEGEYKKCHDLICEVMREYPDAPQPHNILGILLEKTGHHPEAMNHFRAALALDATYRPAEENLETYGTFHCHGKCAYDEMDCEAECSKNYSIVYDDQNIGYVVRRK